MTSWAAIHSGAGTVQRFNFASLASLGGGEQLFRLQFNRREVINCYLKGDCKSDSAYFNRAVGQRMSAR
jgi:hypothetical protein